MEAYKIQPEKVQNNSGNSLTILIFWTSFPQESTSAETDVF
jgi:hypothetical protein